MRGLSRNFMEELQKGMLSPLLQLVREDFTLCLEIRKNYINVYYRGGNIIRIRERRAGSGIYIPWFDKKYLSKKRVLDLPKLPTVLQTAKDAKEWARAIPFLKQYMDFWFSRHHKDEREYQQLVVRENNLGKGARSTDYFICDIEYANTNKRFDLIAVCWPSSPTARKNNRNVGLAFIEMKYGDGALIGKAGLRKHMQDMTDFLAVSGRLNGLKVEMKLVFNQMRELGLINNKKDIVDFRDENPEYIFILANHDPASKILARELRKLEPSYPNLKLKFAVGNFMGYGLYQQNIYSLKEFLKRFKEQI